MLELGSTAWWDVQPAIAALRIRLAHMSACAPTTPALQALAARRSTLYNQHDAAAVAAFLRASGRSSTCRLAWSDTGVVQQWTVA